jgi:hypothetical protein
MGAREAAMLLLYTARAVMYGGEPDRRLGCRPTGSLLMFNSASWRQVSHRRLCCRYHATVVNCHCVCANSLGQPFSPDMPGSAVSAFATELVVEQ